MDNTEPVTGVFYNALRSLRLKFITGLILLAMADFLLLRHIPGISIAIFIILLCSASALINYNSITGKRLSSAFFILLLSILPILESQNTLSLTIGLSGTIIFNLLISGIFSNKLFANLKSALITILLGPFRLLADIALLHNLNKRIKQHIGKPNTLILWILPLLLSLIFIALFIKANPIIQNLIINFDHDIDLNFTFLTKERLFFWLLMIILIWPFMHLKKKIRGKKETISLANVDGGKTLLDILLNPHTVLRSLILFNAIFSLQTGLDLTYLWAGFSLPEGMNYADYAHKGAYPLVATAILAACFVLFSLRPGSATYKSQLIRTLVYLWIAQNILLVLSAILRLNLYVEVYYLTHLRVAAFVWMGLVACGLFFIILRIAFNQSNNWLLTVNSCLLALTLYVYSLTNIDYYIATYNTTHVGKSHKKNAALDQYYLCQLKEQAIPAIDRYISNAETNTTPDNKNRTYHSLRACREENIHNLRYRLSNWRGWNYRSQRLADYLKKQKSAKPVSADGP